MPAPARLALAALLLTAPLPAFACACCTEIGQRFEGRLPLDGSKQDLLAALAFQPTARFYASVAFPDDVKGVAEPSSDAMALTLDRPKGALLFSFAEAGGKRAATLRLPLPQTFEERAVDTRDTDREGGTGPGLYREWHLTGTATLSGFLAATRKQAKATLILHGHGNGCVSDADFHAWTLEVKDGPVAFRLLGRIGPETTEAP